MKTLEQERDDVFFKNSYMGKYSNSNNSEERKGLEYEYQVNKQRLKEAEWVGGNCYGKLSVYLSK